MALSEIGYYGVFTDEHWKRKRSEAENVFFPAERESASLIVDSNSLVRNSINTAKSLSSVSSAVNSFVCGSAFIGGALGVPIGLSIVRDGYLKGKSAYQYGDSEGAFYSGALALCGAGYAGVSSLLATEGVMGLARTSVPVAFTPAIGGLGIAMSGAILGYSAYGLKETVQFKKGLERAKEGGGERAAIEFINRQVCLTHGEILGKSDQEIAKSLQKKWNGLERRVGADCAKMIRETAPDLMKNFDLEKAKSLITQVEKANFKERVKHVMLLVVGFISALAFAGLLLTTGPFTPLLFAVGALLWIGIDSISLHEWIGEKCWGWHCKREKESPDCPIPSPSLKEISSTPSA